MLRPFTVSIVLFVAGACAAAQAPAGPLSIATTALPKARLHQAYSYELSARGGTAPLHWQVASGALPPGLTLDARSGRVVGAPSAVGEFHFTVQVSDREQPPQTAEREWVLKVVSPLTVEWKRPPRIENNNAIRGAVAITNGTDDDFDMTLIVVAVNEIGKAFALGYQHYTLAPETTSPAIEFGATLPAGHYVVHVDAVAEVPAHNEIHRARLQTSSPMALSGLP